MRADRATTASSKCCGRGRRLPYRSGSRDDRSVTKTAVGSADVTDDDDVRALRAAFARLDRTALPQLSVIYAPLFEQMRQQVAATEWPAIEAMRDQMVATHVPALDQVRQLVADVSTRMLEGVDFEPWLKSVRESITQVDVDRLRDARENEEPATLVETIDEVVVAAIDNAQNGGAPEQLTPVQAYWFVLLELISVLLECHVISSQELVLIIVTVLIERGLRG